MRLHWSYSVLIVGTAYAVVLFLIHYVLDIPRGEIRTCAVFTGVIFGLILVLQLTPATFLSARIIRDFVWNLNKWARVRSAVRYVYLSCFVLVAVAWMRSFELYDEVLFPFEQGRHIFLQSHIGRVSLAYHDACVCRISESLSWYSTENPWSRCGTPRTGFGRIAGISKTYNPFGNAYYEVWIGYALLFVLLLALGVTRVARGYHYYKRLELHVACTQCDYDLTGNVSGICPECGTPIPQSNDDSAVTA